MQLKKKKKKKKKKKREVLHKNILLLALKPPKISQQLAIGSTNIFLQR
jgi:hypothetical protein